MKGGLLVPALAMLATAVPAAAQDKRELCPDRPGMGTSACTVEPGSIVVDVGLADWTRDAADGVRSDTVLIGDTQVRFGVADTIELRVGWTPLGFSRESAGGIVDKAMRVGDATLGAKINLANPDGSGFSVALQPEVTLPVGRAPIGAGDWGADLIAAVSYDLSDTVQLHTSPRIEAAVDADGSGRHLAFGGVVGVGMALNDLLYLDLEVQAVRDRDPAGATTSTYGGISLAVARGEDMQFDLGANLGLNRASEDVQLYAGVSRRF